MPDEFEPNDIRNYEQSKQTHFRYDFDYRPTPEELYEFIHNAKEFLENEFEDIDVVDGFQVRLRNEEGDDFRSVTRINELDDYDEYDVEEAIDEGEAGYGSLYSGYSVVLIGY